MYRIPDQKSEKTDRILMVRNGFNNHLTRRFRILPALRRNHLSCGSVDYFPPPFRGINGIYLKLLRMKTFHKPDTKSVSSRGNTVAD